MNAAASTIRDVGYSKHSRWVTLAYGPDLDEFEQAASWCDMIPDQAGNPQFYFERDLHAAFSKENK